MFLNELNKIHGVTEDTKYSDKYIVKYSSYCWGRGAPRTLG